MSLTWRMPFRDISRTQCIRNEPSAARPFRHTILDLDAVFCLVFKSQPFLNRESFAFRIRQQTVQSLRSRWSNQDVNHHWQGHQQKSTSTYCLTKMNFSVSLSTVWFMVLFQLAGSSFVNPLPRTSFFRPVASLDFYPSTRLLSSGLLFEPILKREKQREIRLTYLWLNSSIVTSESLLWNCWLVCHVALGNAINSHSMLMRKKE